MVCICVWMCVCVLVCIPTVSGVGKTFHPGLPPDFDGAKSWSDLNQFPYVNKYLDGDKCPHSGRPSGDGPHLRAFGLRRRKQCSAGLKTYCALGWKRSHRKKTRAVRRGSRISAEH